METDILIKRCQEGDKAALGELYRTYSYRMMSLVRRYVTDIQDAQDVLHDGFLIIFDRISQLRDPSKVEYWMGTIMRNLSKHYKKDQDIIQTLTDEIDPLDVPDFEDAITLDELESMISRLPNGYQNVFRLAALEHRTHKEISQLLGISEGASGSQLFHARVMLRKMIADYKRGLTFLLSGLVAGLGILTDKKHECIDVNDIFASINKTEFNKMNNRTATVISTNDICITNNRTTNLATEAFEKNSDLAVLVEIDTAGFVSHYSSLDSINLRTTEDDSIISRTARGLNVIDVANVDLPILYKSKEIGKKAGINMSIGYILGASIFREPSAPLAGIDPSEPELDDFGAYEAHHAIPLTFSFNIYKEITNRAGLESGIQYASLRTKLTSYWSMLNVKTQYIGIPLRMRYYGETVGKFTFYGNIGTMVEFPIKGSVQTYIFDEGVTINRFTPPIQWSVSLGAGIEYELGRNFDIFAEPSIVYYFRTTNVYPTLRQDRPFEYIIPMGLRYKF